MASLMGGIASQECLKILTKQYIPVNNTVIVDGMRSTTMVFDM
jgi:amyloid beta precursor protein binding protein 1